MLKGIEYKDLYFNSLDIINAKDSIDLEQRKSITRLTGIIIGNDKYILSLERKIDTFWDDLKEMGLGVTIGFVLAGVLVLLN